ncbi:hypothetical protein [Streptomyces antnestii]|uniref:hypothetical protein n=1 Tax=Streptomyces antnestii TaxID=2494256 RepID=UPI001671FBE8|nr:hypothetical protein [Streptomyces sp. San01]
MTRSVGVLLGEDVPQEVDGHRVGQVSARTGEIAVGGQCGHRLVCALHIRWILP